MTNNNSDSQIIAVRSHKGFLFNFNPITMEIEIRRRGLIYIIDLNDLMEFASKSERNTFYVGTYTDDDEETDSKKYR